MSAIYFVTLQATTDNPFKPVNDEVSVSKEETAEQSKSESSKKGKGKAEESEPEKEALSVKIDFDGITDRVLKLDIKPGNYWNITAIDNSVYYVFNSAKTSGP